jgi:hypothetical protein
VPLFYIDASDPKDSNWLRFIRSTSDPTKYNTICMQQNQQINYFTYKVNTRGQPFHSTLTHSLTTTITTTTGDQSGRGAAHLPAGKEEKAAQK